MVMQEHLFYDTIEGLTIYPNFITAKAEENIVKSIEAEEWDNQLSRRVQHYGAPYNYKSRDVSEIERLPHWLKYRTAGVELFLDPKYEFNQVIINEYLPGQGIAPHIDSDVFGDTIASLSLLSDIDMNFIHNDQVITRRLERRSLLVLNGDARWLWKHSIAKRVKDDEIPRSRRISITMRRIND